MWVFSENRQEFKFTKITKNSPSRSNVLADDTVASGVQIE